MWIRDVKTVNWWHHNLKGEFAIISQWQILSICCILHGSHFICKWIKLCLMLHVHVIHVLNTLIILNYLYMYMDHHGIMAFIVYVIIHKKILKNMKKFLYLLSYDVIKSVIAFQEISQNYTIYWRQKLTQVCFHSSIWETCKKICLVYDRHSVYLDKHVSLWLHQYSLAPICMDKVNAASGICKFLA